MCYRYMYWYRRPPDEAFSRYLSSDSALHCLRFAWCNKIYGHIHETSSGSLCSSCYGLLDESTKLEYEGLYTHLMSDGHRPPIYACDNCKISLVIQNPISLCQLCTSVNLNLLTSADIAGQDMTQLIDPIIIYVGGLEFDVVPSE